MSVLCLCLSEGALCFATAKGQRIQSTSSQHPRRILHPSLVSRPLVTLHINLFHSFLHFSLVSISSFAMLPIVSSSAKQTKQAKLMPLYYILDTTFVPFGEEPVTLSNALPYAEASGYLAYLKSLKDGGDYEIVEA